MFNVSVLTATVFVRGLTCLDLCTSLVLRIWVCNILFPMISHFCFTSWRMWRVSQNNNRSFPNDSASTKLFKGSNLDGLEVILINLFHKQTIGHSLIIKINYLQIFLEQKPIIFLSKLLSWTLKVFAEFS